MNSKRLTRLIEAYVDGRLTEAEAEELSGLLTASPAARRQFWEHATVHGLTQEAIRQQWLAEAGPNVGPKILHTARWRRLAPVAAAALAVAVVVTATAWWLGETDERLSDGVAVLSCAVDVDWGDAAVPPAPGMVLAPQTLRLKSGAVLLEFYNGARVALQGPAEFRLVSAEEGFLRSGRLTAHVPPQARGFRLNSPILNVVDFGTDFGLSIPGDTEAEVHVFTGNVEVESVGSGPASRSLKGGEAVRVAARQWHDLPADREAFLDEAELMRRDAVRAQQRYAAWREESRALSTDPSTVIHYTFEGQPPMERQVTNQVASAPLETHGTLVACTWTEGRWPDKRALAFGGEGDRVRFTAAEPLQEVTLLASVCIDALPQGINSLLSADTEQEGALRWELSRDGRLRLGIARDLGRRRADWEVVQSEPILTSERLGQWVLLATTFDGKTVRHYCNGEPVASGAAFRPPALLLGSAEIGNSRGRSPRGFLGRVDEFVVLSRALTAEDVLRLYEARRP